MQLKGSTFIVTGGASGLGEETVRTLVEGDANVVIADLQVEKGQALAQSLGKQVRFIKTDITNEEDGKAAVALAGTEFGGLQGLVNCAGIAVAEKTVGKNGPHVLGNFTRCITVNLIGTFNMIRLAAVVMTKGQPNATD